MSKHKIYISRTRHLFFFSKSYISVWGTIFILFILYNKKSVQCINQHTEQLYRISEKNGNNLLATLSFLYFTIFRQINDVVINIIPTYNLVQCCLAVKGLQSMVCFIITQ